MKSKIIGTMARHGLSRGAARGTREDQKEGVLSVGDRTSPMNARIWRARRERGEPKEAGSEKEEKEAKERKEEQLEEKDTGRRAGMKLRKEIDGAKEDGKREKREEKGPAGARDQRGDASSVVDHTTRVHAHTRIHTVADHQGHTH